MKRQNGFARFLAMDEVSLMLNKAEYDFSFMITKNKKIIQQRENSCIFQL